MAYRRVTPAGRGGIEKAVLAAELARRLAPSLAPSAPLPHAN